MSAFWHVTSQGLPEKEGQKLYVYRPKARVQIAFFRGPAGWWDANAERELVAPYCWANIEDIPPVPR